MMAVFEIILSVLLCILKIAGIIILTVLGLLLAVIAAVLFVPVRYRAEGSFDMEGLCGSAGVSWLLHILSVRVMFDGKKTHFCARIFGIKLVDSDRPKKQKEQNKQKKQKQHNVQNVENSLDTEKNAENKETVQNENDIKAESDTKAERDTKTESDTKAGNDTKSEENADAGKNTNAEREDKENNSEKNIDKKMLNEKLCEKISNIKFKILQICDKIKNINGVRAEYTEFLNAPASREALRTIKIRLFKILRHIMPVRIRANIAFGLPDPAVTGEAYGAACVLLAVYGGNINITPHFVGVDKAFAEGNFRLKGRIRLAVILIHLFKIYTNKRVKEFLAFIKGKGKQNGR